MAPIDSESNSSAPPEPSMTEWKRGAVFDSDRVLRVLTGASALVVLLMVGALLGILAAAALPSISQFGLKFLVSTEWRANELERPVRTPQGRLVLDKDGERVMETIPPAFGALPVIYGTVASSAIALLVAIPLSLGCAIFLVRISGRWLAGPVSFLVEFLAAIPSIAYGIWALFVLAPFLNQYVEPVLRDGPGAISFVRDHVPVVRSIAGLGSIPGVKSWLFEQEVQVGKRTIRSAMPLTGRDMFCGGLILAIMIIPIITALCRDVLGGVPRAQVEGTTALGATWWQSSKEMLKYSRSGLFGAILLGLARAAGETMAITMVIGNKNQIDASPFAPAQTMSSLLANEFAEATSELHRSALVEVALVLLLMSLAFNVIARYLVVGKDSRSAAAH